MGKTAKAPARLYKYRGFSNLTLEMLVGDTVYFADPSSFNDPLDAKPTLDADVDAPALESMLTRLVKQRAEAEMSAAAKTIRYRGPKTIEHISRHSRREAAQLIERIRYDATNPEYEIADPERFLLGHYVESELLQRDDKGVLSLAERAHCPLMWSHYGDQHRGLCIGYSIPDDVRPDLHKISYGGSRLVQPCTRGRALAPRTVPVATGVIGNRRIKTALRMGRLNTVKTLAAYDFAFQPSLDKARILALAELNFVARCEVVHLLGPPGTGKSHLASALGIEAIKAGKSVSFITLADLIGALAKAEREGVLREKIRFYCRPSLLIVDEIGYLPVVPGGGNLFFQLVNARYEKGAMILTSNRGFAEWGEIFGSPVVATALLDRLLHHAIVVQIDGSSYRLRRHAELLPEHVRSNTIITPPASQPRRRGRPPGGASLQTR